MDIVDLVAFSPLVWVPVIILKRSKKNSASAPCTHQIFQLFRFFCRRKYLQLNLSSIHHLLHFINLISQAFDLACYKQILMKIGSSSTHSRSIYNLSSTFNLQICIRIGKNKLQIVFGRFSKEPIGTKNFTNTMIFFL